MLRPDKIRTRHASDSLFYPPLARVFPGALLFPGKGRHDFLFPSSAEDEGRIRKEGREPSPVEGKITGGEGEERERERESFIYEFSGRCGERERE